MYLNEHVLLDSLVGRDKHTYLTELFKVPVHINSGKNSALL